MISGDLTNFLAPQGITVEKVAMSPTDAVLAVINGQADMANSPIQTIVQARAQGNDLKFIAPTFGGHVSLISRPDGPTSLEELQGMRIGALARTSSSYSDLLLIAEEEGFDLETDFQLTFGNLTLLTGLLEQGELDAITSFEPNTTRFIYEGTAQEIFSYNAKWRELTGFSLPVASLMVSQEWIDETGLLPFVQQASFENVDSLKNDFTRYSDEPELFGMSDDEALKLLFDRMSPLFQPEFTQEVIDGYNFYIEKAAAKGLIEGLADANDFLVL
ncbi:MAG: ABC transporter substrate-binding protein [Chloroflexi bacterium]|nr:ABC transporter substrate-binding protein [Chloroflexota bacterium]